MMMGAMSAQQENAQARLDATHRHNQMMLLAMNGNVEMVELNTFSATAATAAPMPQSQAASAMICQFAQASAPAGPLRAVVPALSVQAPEPPPVAALPGASPPLQLAAANVPVPPMPSYPRCQSGRRMPFSTQW